MSSPYGITIKTAQILRTYARTSTYIKGLAMLHQVSQVVQHCKVVRNYLISLQRLIRCNMSTNSTYIMISHGYSVSHRLVTMLHMDQSTHTEGLLRGYA